MISHDAGHKFDEKLYRSIVSKAVQSKVVTDRWSLDSKNFIRTVEGCSSLLIVLHYWVNTGNVATSDYAGEYNIKFDLLLRNLIMLAATYRGVLEAGGQENYAVEQKDFLKKKRSEKSGIMGADWFRENEKDIDICLRLKACALDAGLPENTFFGPPSPDKGTDFDEAMKDPDFVSTYERIYELNQTNSFLNHDEHELSMINKEGRVSVFSWEIRILLDQLELSHSDLKQKEWFPTPYKMLQDILGVTGLDVDTNRIEEVVQQSVRI